MNTTLLAGQRPAEIVIVDDMPANLQLLVHFLRHEGYRVRPVTSGAAALALAAVTPPDLVLMDVSMPEMDGYEACRRLKAIPRLQSVPVVFLSALGDPMDKVRAFEVGGVDYITKPFHLEEVRVRIDTHLRLRRLQTEMEDTCRQLQVAETVKGHLVHLLIHDMRTPLFNISASVELLELCESVAADAAARRHLGDAKDSVQILEQMIADILDVYKMEGGSAMAAPGPAPVADFVGEAIRLVGGLMKRHRFAYTLPPPTLLALCDPDLSARVLLNFFSNAVKHSPVGSEIRLQVEEEPDRIRLSVSDQSPGLAPGEDQGLFDKAGLIRNGKRRAKSLGLGLVFCRMVAEAQGGQIGVTSQPGAGCTFWFTLPKPPVDPAGAPKETAP